MGPKKLATEQLLPCFTLTAWDPDGFQNKEHRELNMHTHTQMKGSKLTHQSTFLYNIKSTISTLTAYWMAISRPCIQLSQQIMCTTISFTEIDWTTNNKIHDRPRTYMAHVLSFGSATCASAIKFFPRYKCRCKTKRLSRLPHCMKLPSKTVYTTSSD